MADLLHKLENNEAILLMYAAGELDEQDRREVEQMLAVDAGLRAEYEQLVALHDQMEQQLADADSRVHLAVPAALTRVNRAMRQWQVDRLAGDPVEPPVVKQLRYPWWSYPAASAAAVILATLVWFGHSSKTFEYTMPADPQAQRLINETQLRFVRQLESSFGGQEFMSLYALNEIEADIDNLPMDTSFEF